MLHFPARIAQGTQGAMPLFLPFLYIIKTDLLKLGVPPVRRHSYYCPANTCLGKSCSLGLPRVPFVNCCQFMYLVISLLVLRSGCEI